MPGIVGVITKRPKTWASDQLHRMMKSMMHESFYSTAVWTDEAQGVYVGSIARKGSFADGMPLVNEAKSRVLLFAGEEYNEPGTRQDLLSRGHAVDTRSADYLIHLAEEDQTFPRNLNGRFHGLLADLINGTSILFNDRYGMNRIYYHEGQDAFFFAAEAKAILAVLPQLRETDPHALAQFVSCGCVLEDRTLFREINVLPVASAWRFRNGVIESKGRYFEASEWENQDPLPAEEYYQQLKEAFTRNLPRYFNGREKLGVSLTGGLDTRMIMAWHRAAPQSLPTYTFGGPFRDCQDVVIARKVAQVCGQSHQVIPVGDEFLSRFSHYAERAVYLSDGCAAVNRAADLYANEIAAQIAPIRITGNYGSEILRRLRAFKPVEPAAGVFQPEFEREIGVTKQTFERLIQGHAVSFTAFRQAPWYQYGLLALEQTQLSLRSPFLDNDVVRAAFRAPSSSIVKNDIFEDNDDCGRLIADGSTELYKIPTDRGLGGAGGWTSAFARAFLEVTFKAEYAYDYGMPQSLAKLDHAVSWLHLERLFLGRHKFCHFRVWYRDQLSSYVREILLDDRALGRPYLQRKVVEALVNDHLKGTRNYTTEIHRLLTLELQQRLFIDQQVA